MGRGCSARTVYLIDYGLAKRFRDPMTKIHIPYKEGKRLTGTARYASINTHIGIEQARRDDLECLGYTLIYLAKGGLSWQGIKDSDKKEKYNKIGDKKSKTPTVTLCEGLPQEFVNYMNYCLSLSFEDKPDYTSLKKLFRNLFIKSNFQLNFSFDWEQQQPTIVPPTVEKKKSSSNGTRKADCADEKHVVEDERNKSTTLIRVEQEDKSVPKIPLIKGASYKDFSQVTFNKEEIKGSVSPVATLILSNTGIKHRANVSKDELTDTTPCNKEAVEELMECVSFSGID